MTARVDIKAARTSRGEMVWAACYQGKVLCASTSLPVFDTCRALKALGVTGRVEIWRPARDTYSIACDIERGALLTIKEGARHDLRRDRWSPPVPEAISRARGCARTAKQDRGGGSPAEED